MRLHDLNGIIYTLATLPVVASGANSALEAICPSPFSDRNGYVESIDLITPEIYTGDATNTQNMNAQLVAGTEIGNLDLGAANNTAVGVPKAFTMTGTDAQRTIAAGGCIIIQREEVGTQPARIAGAVVRVGWKAA